MLDLIGAMAGMAAMMISLVAIASVLPLSFAQKLAGGGAAGAWIGLASGLAAAGDLAFSPQHPVPLVGVLFATPLLTAVTFWFAAPRFRAALMAIPMPLLIGLNIARVFGGLFLLLAMAGRLSGPFPYFAGLGDVITGLLAARFALTAARGGEMRDAQIAAWNRFGALDLVVAVGLGLTSAQGSPLQVIHAGVGSLAMQYLPYSLIPTVLVPFYLVTHAIIAAQLSARRSARQLVSALSIGTSVGSR
jgi:hypothetical protein